jgi:hypothetical protein
VINLAKNYMKIFIRKKKNLKKYKFSFLEKHIIVSILLNAKFLVGWYYNVLITQYLIGIRRKHSVLNCYFLISQARKMLYDVYLHSYFKELIVIFSSDHICDMALGKGLFYFFSEWPDGFLTNFRLLIRRYIMDKRYRNTSELSISSISAYFVTKRPQLPTIAISLGDHYHWFFNEAHHLGLIQYGPDTPQSNVLPFNHRYGPISIMLRLIRESIIAAKLDDRLFFINKRRYKHRNKYYYKPELLWLFKPFLKKPKKKKIN